MNFRKITYQISPVAKMLVNSSRKRGLFRTLRLAFSEFIFDLKNSTSTTGVIPTEHLRTTSASWRWGNRYEGSNPTLFFELMAGLPDSARDGAFVDFGSGKGRALMLASQFGFKNLIGIEYSEELCEISKQNLANWRTKKRMDYEFEIVCSDAGEFTIPDKATVLYFFNPFQEAVFQRVSEKIQESISRNRREIFIVYLNPYFLKCFEDIDFRSYFNLKNDAIVLKFDPR
jgi:SAM-dependent methyltransferase